MKALATSDRSAIKPRRAVRLKPGAWAPGRRRPAGPPSLHAPAGAEYVANLRAESKPGPGQKSTLPRTLCAICQVQCVLMHHGDG